MSEKFDLAGWYIIVNMLTFLWTLTLVLILSKIVSHNIELEFSTTMESLAGAVIIALVISVHASSSLPNNVMEKISLVAISFVLTAIV